MTVAEDYWFCHCHAPNNKMSASETYCTWCGDLTPLDEDGSVRPTNEFPSLERRMAPPRITEIKYQVKLAVEFCKIEGVYARRQNVGKIKITDDSTNTERYFNAGPTAGAADITGIVAPHGWRLEVEAKMPERKRTEAQLRWARHIEKHGGVYMLTVYDRSLSMRTNLDVAQNELKRVIANRLARAEKAFRALAVKR